MIRGSHLLSSPSIPAVSSHCPMSRCAMCHTTSPTKWVPHAMIQRAGSLSRPHWLGGGEKLSA